MTALTRRSLRTLLVALGLLAPAVPLAAQTIQLQDGTLLVGKVEDPHEDGLTFKRLDTGGMLQLRWSQLAPHSAQRIKQMKGLSVDDETEIFTTAEVLTFEAAGRRDTVIGKIVEETAEEIVVQRQGSRFPIARARIKGRGTKEVPVLEILTEEQFYYEKLAELSPGDDADKHVLLADLLARVRAYDLATTHLEKARELGGGSQPSLLEGKLSRLALFKAARDERDLLDQINVHRARGQFAKGLELVEEYAKRFPQGKLQSEFAQTKERFVKARDRAMVARVAELFYKSIRSVADRKANQSGLTYEGAREYAETQMGKDIRERVIGMAELSAEEVEEFWKKRFEYPPALRPIRYPYGLGSWTLGKDKILKDTKQEGASGKEKQLSPEEERLEKITRRIKEAQERARRSLAQSGQAAAPREETPEDWWKSAKAEERKVFIQAYYVENSGDLKVEAAYLSECYTCTGEGFLRVLGSNGREQKTQCPTCHGTSFKRIVRAQ